MKDLLFNSKRTKSAGRCIAALSSAMLLTSGAAFSQTAPQAPLHYGPAISLADAEKMLDGAQAQAAKMNYAGAIAIVGPGGELIAFRRLDGAGLAQSAQNKAYAAVAYRRPTKAFQDAVAAGNVAITTLPNVIASEGGLPIVSQGFIVGAIGSSGGTAQEDGQVAAAGLAAIK